jgi:hypothetical protein
MCNNDDQELPACVREIKRQTEQLIRLFDQAFLRTCGILWEEDMENLPAAPSRKQRLLERLRPAHNDTA